MPPATDVKGPESTGQEEAALSASAAELGPGAVEDPMSIPNEHSENGAPAGPPGCDKPFDEQGEGKDDTTKTLTAISEDPNLSDPDRLQHQQQQDGCSPGGSHSKPRLSTDGTELEAEAAASAAQDAPSTTATPADFAPPPSTEANQSAAAADPGKPVEGTRQAPKRQRQSRRKAAASAQISWHKRSFGRLVRLSKSYTFCYGVMHCVSRTNCDINEVFCKAVHSKLFKGNLGLVSSSVQLVGHVA
eukprot:scaffold169146_cov37-Prasinocladus_malaysianus.AAC.1